MKIGSERSLVHLEAYIKNAQNSEAAKQPAQQEAERASPAESVKISDRARDINRAREIVDATPEIREEKVGHFKREIETGRYTVKADQVAEKMLKEFLLDSL